MAKKFKQLRVVYFDIEQVPHAEFIWQPYAGFKCDKSLLLSVSLWDPIHDKSPTLYRLSKKELKQYVECGDIKNKYDRIAAKNKIDKDLTRAVMEHLTEKADVIVTWYGSRHDMKYMNGKAMMHDLPVCKYVKHIDLYDTAKCNMSLSSNRLGNIARTLGVAPKGDISPDKWDRTRNGHYPSLMEIGYYNIQDVVTLKEVADKLRPLIKTHPHARILDAKHTVLPTAKSRKMYLEKFCRFCGGANVKKNGTYFAGKTVHQRYQCADCLGPHNGGFYV